MTIKHILLPLTGEAGSKDAAVCGLNLAKQLSAHVTVGYEDELGPIYVVPDYAGAAFSYGAFYEQFQKIREERKAQARKYFDAAVAATHIPIVSAPLCQQGSAMWVESRDGDRGRISAQSGLTDLVVLDAPGTRSSAVAWNVVEETLFAAHRLALIVPAGTTTVDFTKPLVAWNGSAEAAKTLQQAIALFPANAKVTILQIGDIKTGRIPAARAADYLGWHCFEVEVRQVKDRPHGTSQILAEEIGRTGATCVVMGAYSHSRTRELLLGGVTDFMLRSPTVPMIMAH